MIVSHDSIETFMENVCKIIKIVIHGALCIMSSFCRKLKCFDSNKSEKQNAYLMEAKYRKIMS